MIITWFHMHILLLHTCIYLSIERDTLTNLTEIFCFFFFLDRWRSDRRSFNSLWSITKVPRGQRSATTWSWEEEREKEKGRGECIQDIRLCWQPGRLTLLYSVRLFCDCGIVLLNLPSIELWISQCSAKQIPNIFWHYWVEIVTITCIPLLHWQSTCTLTICMYAGEGCISTYNWTRDWESLGYKHFLAFCNYWVVHYWVANCLFSTLCDKITCAICLLHHRVNWRRES